MRKSSKGALAGAAAAVLLLGGFGTHAAWQDQGTVGGGEINTGHLYLTSSCDPWSLVNDVLDATKSITEGDLSSVLMIPGDVLSRSCTFTVHIEGDNLATADLTLTGQSPEVKNGLTTLTELDATAVFTGPDGVITGPVELEDGEVVEAELSVELDPDLIGLQGQDLQGVLDGLTVTVAQS